MEKSEPRGDKWTESISISNYFSRQLGTEMESTRIPWKNLSIFERNFLNFIYDS